MTIKEEQFSKEVGRMHKKLIKLRAHTDILREAVIKKRRALNLYCWRMKLLKQYDEELYYKIRKYKGDWSKHIKCLELIREVL